ncbi:MAG: radical SAM protein [Patescibacteria group bacterium]
MANDFGIDSHKLSLHPERVSQWLKGNDNWDDAQKIYPIYVEISPSGLCNHSCSFCGLDFTPQSKAVFLKTDVLKDRLSEMASLGVKSVMFAGEGEPLLHKDMAEITAHTKNSGIDAAFTTNGTCLTKRFCETAISSIEWIKVSINAGTPKTYAKIHNAPENHFELVLKNISEAVNIRNKKMSNCVIGAQAILLPDNKNEMETLAKLVRDAGCDYLVIKPHSQHPQSVTSKYQDVSYEKDEIKNLEGVLSKLNGSNFKIIFRSQTMERISKGKTYSKCFSTPFFWGYVSSAGDVYSCSIFLGDERFLLGNIAKQSFQEIWEGEKRRENWKLMKDFNASGCRDGCRMDACNRYLCSLKNPPEHFNFI